jgi:hypothetical protein
MSEEQKPPEHLPTTGSAAQERLRSADAQEGRDGHERAGAQKQRDEDSSAGAPRERD